MPDPTPERLAELRRIAEAATPGPWEWREREHNERIRKRERAGRRSRRQFVYCLQGPPLSGVAPEHRDEFDYHNVMSLRWDQVKATTLTGVAPSRVDADFIAAFDPTTVLALLNRIEELERQVHLANNLAMSAEQLVKAWEANEGDLTLYLDDLRHDLTDYYTRYGTGDSETPSDEQPGAVIALTQDDCLILMWGLIDPDEYLCTGDGQTIPPSEDTPEMRQTRERYRRLVDRIIDVGAGLAGGDNDV